MHPLSKKDRLIGIKAYGRLAFGLLLTTAACASSPSNKPATSATPAPQAAPSRPQMRQPQWLPPQAREILSLKMQRHGDDMMFLMASVVLLSYDGAEQLAERIASEPRIAPPAPGERDTVNALLPQRFFELQEEARVRAKAVAEAARRKDNTRLVQTHAKLTETCVSCHALYLQDEFKYEEHEEHDERQ